MTHRELLYPVFLDSCNYIENIFWENIFEEMAYGKCPMGVFFHGDYICSKIKGREFSYKIDNSKSAKTIYKDIYKILSEKMKILSIHDKNKIQDEYKLIENTLKNERKNWIDIKKKNIKETFIETYILSSQKKYNLSFDKAKELLSYISTAISLKNILSSDINWDGKKITNINGIQFKNGIVIYDNFNREKSSNIIEERNIIFKNNLMSDNWYKYLKNEIKK